MNERIKLLAEQAGAVKVWEWASDDVLDTKNMDAEKFAQLIAKDCAKMLDEDSYIMPELGGYAHDIRTRYGVNDE